MSINYSEILRLEMEECRERTFDPPVVWEEGQYGSSICIKTNLGFFGDLGWRTLGWGLSEWLF